MNQVNFNLWSLILQIITAVAAGIFAFFQYKINNRLKKIQDYVAVSIVPMGPGDLRLQVINVGKINLYLQKHEIGMNKESFAKGMLIPAGSNSFLLLPIKNHNLNQKMDVKLYLIDELGERFISTGEAVVKEIEGLKESKLETGQIAHEKIKIKQVSAWSFKTLKRDWEI